MSRVLIIGAGAVGRVVVKKCLKNPDIFTDVHVASRTLAKCHRLKQECQSPITIHELDADVVPHTVALIQAIQPDLVINVALPYQDLAIMDACVATKTHYMDTANYEPRDEAAFSYSWQWKYQDAFRQIDRMALLGCGFDPGVTNVFIQYAATTLFDSIEQVDIMDCNDGNHGYPFVTNFNPEINIREITQDGRYFDNNQWHDVPALSVKKAIDFPEVGVRTAYLLYHEELESLIKHIPSIQRIRFWMTFSDTYLQYLRVLQDVGMTRIDPVSFQGQSIVPLEFLKELLPNPADISQNYQGKTCIGCMITGKIKGETRTKLIYNVCHHPDCHADVGAQAVSYTTGVPAMIGAKLILNGTWRSAGVFNMEQMNPQHFMDELPHHGLPWRVMDCDGPLD